MDFEFTPKGTILGMNLNVSMPDNRNYAIGGSTGPMSGAIFSGNATARVDPANAGTFMQSSSLTILPGAGAAAGTCGGGCSADVQGFFAGPKAERVGLNYRIEDGIPGRIQTNGNSLSVNPQIVGAAAFKKQ